MSDIVLYIDPECTKIAESLDLGRVEIGRKMKYTVYLKNTDKEWPIDNIKAVNLSEEIKISLPDMLQPQEVKEMSVYWTPKVGARVPLLTNFSIKGDLLIG